MPTPHPVKDFFEQRSARYVRYSRWASSPAIFDMSQTMLDDASGRVALDLGAGTGLLISNLRLRFDKLIAADLSFAMASQVTAPHIQPVVCDAHRAPFRDGAMDLVLCRQMLHYCDAELVLREASRITANSGLLHVVQLTDHDGADEAWLADWVGLRKVRGRKRFSREALLQVVRANGFDVELVSSVDLRVSHTWHDFFAKNLVPCGQEEAVREFFMGGPAQTLALYDFEFTDEGLSYTRVFTGVNARLGGASNERVGIE